MIVHRLLVFAALPVIALIAAARPALAEDPQLKFIHGLQDQDKGDVAAEYLKMLKERSSMLPEVAEVWDLEMSKSLRAAANRAFDAKDFDEQMNEAQKYLDKFIKEKPNHPEVVTAMVSGGTFLVDRAKQHLRAALGLSDKAQWAAHANEARKALETAGPEFKLAIEKYKDQLAAAPPAGLPPTKRETAAEKRARQQREEQRANLEGGRLDARFQAALVDYYLAQTYDPADKKTEPQRKAVLKKAAEGFDAIYQTNRVNAANMVNVVGLYAHMWHGKVMQELGDNETAADIYDEVLANVPDPAPGNQVATGLEPLFAQVQYFRMLILAKQSKLKFIAEAAEWLQTYRNYRSTDGYQGITLELAKTEFDAAASGKASDRDAAKLRTDAMTRLAEASRVHSQYQSEAILMMRKLKKAGGGTAEAATFDEAVTLAEAALQSGQGADALAGFQRALELSKNVKDAARVQAVRDRLATARLVVVGEQYQQGKYEECLTAAGQLVKEFQGTPVGPSASALAVHAALALYADAVTANRDASAELERLVKIANFTINTWPNKPEADDARMALGQASLATRKTDEALAVFQKVNPKSDRYPVALYLSAQTYWRRYVLGMRQANANKEQLAADRAKARDLLKTSLDIQRRTVEHGAPLPQQLIDTQLLLAEITLDANQPQDAVALFKPLVQAVKTARPESLDNTTLRIFCGAVLGYAALNDIPQASEVGTLLLELGPDVPAVNSALVEFARRVNEARKKAEAAASAAPAGDAKTTADRKAKLKAVEELLGNLAKKLAERKQLNGYGMVFVADTCVTLGMDAEAKKLYQGFLDRLGNDMDFARTAIKAKTRVLAQLIGLLRKEGDFQEAYRQVVELVKTNPHSLEPRMEQGRILQSWAEKDAAKYAEAVRQWIGLRNRLQSMPKKPPEYYEVTYDLAYCLAAVGITGNQPDKLKESEQVLKSTLVLSPQLSGPDTVAKYNALLAELAAKLRHPAK